MKQALFFMLLMLSFTQTKAQSKKYKIHTIAFYNFENLFDTINNPSTEDDEWTPKGFQHWNGPKYNQKLANLGKVISQIGTAEHNNSPTLLGCSEIENRMVLEDLIKDPQITAKDYGIIHYDSPDKRGIDVALLYQKQFFKPTSYTNIPLIIYAKDVVNKVESKENTEDENLPQTQNNRIFTRDQLLVTGFLENEEVHIIVNHWPSRSGGEKKSNWLREAAGALNLKIIDSLQQINANAKIITMGDLNDGPFNTSIKKILNTKSKKEAVEDLGIYNPFEEMATKGLGTIAFRDSWDIFDQILMTQSLVLNKFSSFKFWKAGIYNQHFMIQTSGRYKGYPKRHSVTEVGFSDHFPVYIYLIKEE